MPYRICKAFEVQTGHLLSKHPGNCKFPHGHSRRVELILEAGTLDANDMVCDFGVLKSALNTFLQRYDHALCVNTTDPMFETLRAAYGERVVPFENCDPTTELLARRIYDAVSASLRNYARQPDATFLLSGDVRLIRVRVWETATGWAEYVPGE